MTPATASPDTAPTRLILTVHAPRTLGPPVSIEFAAGFFLDAHDNLNSVVPECLNPTAVHSFVRVHHTDDDPAHAGVHQREAARRSPAEMIARLERHVRGAAPRPLARGAERKHLRMRQTSFGMVAFADDATVLVENHASDRRVGMRLPERRARQLHCPSHVPRVICAGG